MKKIISLVLSLAMLLALCSCGEPSPEEIAAENYQQATELLEAGNYPEALEILRTLGDYEDAPSLRREAAVALIEDYLADTNQVNMELGAENTDFLQKYGNGMEAIPLFFPHAMAQKITDDYTRILAMDEAGNIVFCLMCYQDTPNTNLWFSWITLREDGTSTQSFKGEYYELNSAFGGGAELINGENDFDPARYHEGDSLDMTVRQVLTANNTLYSDMSINLYATRTDQEEVRQLDSLITGMESLLSEAGVTLGDLGFTALDEAPSDAAPAADTEANNETAEETKEPSKPSAGSVQGDAIALTTEDGMAEIKYAGYEYMPAGVLTDETVDLSKVIVIFMDYTNHREDEPSQMQGDFRYRVFQNGVELDSNFSSYYGDKYAPLEAYFKEVMMGGTVTTGNFFLLEDDSPITIVANEQGNKDNKQSMTVELN